LSSARDAGLVEGAVVSESIDRIRSAEQEAGKLEQAARAQSKALIAEAHDAGERLLDEGRKVGWAEEKTLRAAAAKEAEVEAEKLVVESRSSVESVRTGAVQRVEAGIKKVLEVITAGAAETRG
jgi:vacuolar-type H+-ATPase subunit H